MPKLEELFTKVFIMCHRYERLVCHIIMCLMYHISETLACCSCATSLFLHILTKSVIYY